MNISLARHAGAALTTCVLVAACGSADPSDADDVDTMSASFPVTIEHRFGETTIDGEPQRVVSIGFGEHDGLLALGVEPIAVRDWYGDMPDATWPWAQDELGDLTPEVVPSTDLNFEQISALDPDLIIGVSSGMSDSDYETLAAIAPTVARSDEFPEYATPWREQLRTAGAAVGRTDRAEEVIAEVEQMYADARDAHPEFEGATATVGFAYQGDPGAYASGDVRSQFLVELGFVIPPEYDELAGDQFFFDVSQEELAMLDTDVIVWLVSDETGVEQLRSMPLRPTLTAVAEGREVVADPLLSGAFSHASALSIEYVLDELVPELALALDGDPSTPVRSADMLDPDGSGTGVTAVTAGDEADEEPTG